MVYLCHPVGTDPDDRAKNLENTKKWFRWLMDNTDFTVCVPWYIYVVTLDETWRKRCLRDDLIILERCDAIVLTGGRITGGMATELGLAQMGGQEVYDLTSVGYEPDEKALDLIPDEYVVGPRQ